MGAQFSSHRSTLERQSLRGPSDMGGGFPVEVSEKPGNLTNISADPEEPLLARKGAARPGAMPRGGFEVFPEAAGHDWTAMRVVFGKRDSRSRPAGSCAKGMTISARLPYPFRQRGRRTGNPERNAPRRARDVRLRLSGLSDRMGAEEMGHRGPDASHCSLRDAASTTWRFET